MVASPQPGAKVAQANPRLATPQGVRHGDAIHAARGRLFQKPEAAAGKRRDRHRQAPARGLEEAHEMGAVHVSRCVQQRVELCKRCGALAWQCRVVQGGEIPGAGHASEFVQVAGAESVEDNA